MAHKLLLVHPGASWSTHDVFTGLRFGLQYQGAMVAEYNSDVRIARSARWLHWNWKLSGKPGNAPTPLDAQYHAATGLLERAMRLEPDWVVIVSGMYFPVEIVDFLRRAGLKVALLLTESPYDDDAQALVVPHVDLAWTNERSSVARLREGNPNVHYLPHAWHPTIHQPQPATVLATQVETGELPAHDVLFIGTGFKERAQWFSKVQWGAWEPAFYGQWSSLGSRSGLRRYVRGGVVRNEAAARMYQVAKVNINLHRTSKGASADGSHTIAHAESLGPRVWELAATGSYFVSDPRAELTETFGDLVPTFTTPDELSERLREAAALPDWQRAKVAAQCQELVQPHSWNARAITVLKGLYGDAFTPPDDVVDTLN